jgi:general stress protein 26
MTGNSFCSLLFTECVEMDMTKKDRSQVWKIIEGFSTCMLTTHSGRTLRARPMSTIVRNEEEKIFLLSDKKASKDEEIDRNKNVGLTFSDGSKRFVSLTATAKVLDDRVLVRSLWNTGAQAFWPKGPDDPDVVAIEILPVAAEVWDGNNMLVSTVKIGFALATGSTPDLGEHRKVAL